MFEFTTGWEKGSHGTDNGFRTIVTMFGHPVYRGEYLHADSRDSRAATQQEFAEALRQTLAKGRARG